MRNFSSQIRTVALVAVWTLCLGAAPSRTCTYTAGQIISPTCVGENEDNVFSYLQAGVDTFANNSIATAKLQDAAVTAAKLTTGAVTTTIILDGTIAATDLAADSVEASEIAAGAVGTSEIATDGVEAAEIAAGAVGASEIASGAVDAGDMATTGTIADDKAFIADSSSAGTWRTITNCTDTGGNHLNYTQSSNAFSCGTSTAGFTLTTFTRDTSTASSTQTVSGLGVTPVFVFVICSQGALATGETSWGFSDSTTDYSLSDSHGETASSYEVSTTIAIDDKESSTATYEGNLGNFASGAFDVVWTRGGTPTGTLSCIAFVKS